MLTIYADNVNDAFDKAVIQMERVGVKSNSRNGGVSVAPHPVMTVYERPWERVLFNRHRDANPFFHLFECLWMLSGSNEGVWLDRFVSDFSARYGEPDKMGMIWGAYGNRWRRWFGFDQLDVTVNRLVTNPNDRRVVIQMWDAMNDYVDPVTDIDNETGIPFEEPRDVPCNTVLYPRIVGGALDITVTCRSNDVVWGAYGANAVHFSFLQEYLAGRIGVKVGKYYQLSNNWHLYDSVADRFQRDPLTIYPRTTAIGENWGEWDADLKKFMGNPEAIVYENGWFLYVARPMWKTHALWKSGDRTGALRAVQEVQAHDWRMAATDWMKRRMEK
jgi:hypothetical protein